MNSDSHLNSVTKVYSQDMDAFAEISPTTILYRRGELSGITEHVWVQVRFLGEQGKHCCLKWKHKLNEFM